MSDTVGRTSPHRQKPYDSRWRGWVIVFLLFLVQTANAADKTVLGLAAEPMMKELKLSLEQYGLLASSFYSLFAVGGLAVAFFIAPRSRPRHILATLLLTWSMLQLPIVLAASFSTVLACRILLGLGEGAGTPTALNCSHEWFANKDRNIPSAVVMFGTTAGPLIAAPLLAHIIHAFGWRGAFLACSTVGTAIFLLWLLLSSDGPHATSHRPPIAHSTTTSKIRQRDIWTDRTILGLCAIGFAAYSNVGFAVSWLAPFVGRALGYSLLNVGWIVAGIYGVHALLLFGITSVSQHMLRRGSTSRTARGFLMVFCMVGSCTAFMVAGYAQDDAVRLGAIALATGFPAPVFPLLAAMISEIAPTAYRNSLMTIILSAITTAGIILPALAGRLLASGGPSGWPHVLILQGAVTLIGGVIACAMLDPAQSLARFVRLQGKECHG